MKIQTDHLPQSQREAKGDTARQNNRSQHNWIIWINPQRQKGNGWLPGAGAYGREDWGVTVEWVERFFGADENSLELNRNGGCIML